MTVTIHNVDNQLLQAIESIVALNPSVTIAVKEDKHDTVKIDKAKLFSKKRLLSYKNEDQHKQNFLLIQQITSKMGIIEIITRNCMYDILQDKLNVNCDVDKFISSQTFGYWIKTLNDFKIHNKLVNLKPLDFRKYSIFNKRAKSTMLNYKKVIISYNLLLTIRNRAFHFENLYKQNKNQSPRITTKYENIIVGIDPSKIETFLNDFLDCFDEGLKNYV